jgi:cholesterol transport system auxiliary component
MVDQYMLEYAPPEVAGPRLDQTVEIGRFSVAQAYNSTAMVYRADGYRVAAPHYHRWRTNPGDMVTDYLLRDFRASGLFRAVFSYRRPEEARFTVEGGIEEFLELREGGGRKAVLGLEVTLLDRSKPEVSERVVFQKRYRAEEAAIDQSSEALARAMSQAMAALSAEIIGDVHRAVRMGAR